MKHQRNLVKTKIPQTSERGPSETELTNLPERDFKIKIINMLKELHKNIQDPRENFKKERETLKNTVSEMKHTMEGFKSTLNEIEETANETEI